MQHFYEDIQGWFNCKPLYERMVAEAVSPARFVEVGAWKGCSTAFMCVEIINSGKEIAFHVVDHFKGGPEHTDYPEVVNGSLAREFAANMTPVKGHYRLWPMQSVYAASCFPNASCDFIYIDGSHDYQDVCSDIYAWLPKVKPGGLLAGDDYDHFPGVKKAVTELLPAAIVENGQWMHRVPETSQTSQ